MPGPARPTQAYGCANRGAVCAPKSPARLARPTRPRRPGAEPPLPGEIDGPRNGNAHNENGHTRRNTLFVP
ncbi:hypothetical protein JCM18897A_24700 [Streptomyces sp. JCM 18897]